jgi:FimV-like protein
MNFPVWFFTSVERVVVLMRHSLVINKAKFFGSLVFFTLILSACAMPANGSGPKVIYVAESKSLWSVALSVKPAEVRMWQAVIAIYERNPDAFYDNDVNKLKGNVTLLVPSTEVMQSLTEAEALVRFQALGDQPQPNLDKLTFNASSNTSIAPKVELANDGNEPRVIYVADSKSLWSVALSVKPTEVRMWQAVVALYERNPDAFYDNDVNKLKGNVTLVVPSTEVMQSLTEAEALVRFQSLGDQPQPNLDKLTLDASSNTSVATKVELSNNEPVTVPNLLTQDNTQASNKKGAHAVFSSDAFAAVRTAIDGAQLNELADKIPTSLAETAINKTENLINQKANEMVNSVGHGKTEISVRQLATKNPQFSIKTIQPLTDLTDESTQLTFTQAQISSGENHGQRRATINLGIGQRYLLEDGQSIAGINLFTDYETESRHSRASLGLEYQRANFSANVNKYHPLSNKVVIGDYTEEPLAGYDIRLTGQVPYLPWAKIKATQYYWDATTGDDIKGTSLGIEANINAATTFEIGTENSNTASRSRYAQLRVQFPHNTAPPQFIIADKAFEDSSRLSLTDLNYVERSNKIRIEKRLNGVDVVLAEYNAVTSGATCTLFNASDVAIANGSGLTGADGSVSLSNVVFPAGLVTMSCTGGTYTDEATGKATNAPNLRAGVIYSGTGDVIIMASPLSEIAYQLAGTNLASTITAKNAEVATAFGLNSVDIISTIPTDINTATAANDDAGKLATVLAAVSQMGENSSDANPTVTITALVTDMADGDIDGRNTGTEVVDIAEAINNFETSTGDNNTSNGAGAENIDSSDGEGTVKGDLAIAFIDAYDSTGTAPTIQQYVDAGVTGVTVDNVAAINAAVANQTAGTTAQIQALANTGSTTASSAIAAINAYDGTNTAPTVQQYVDAGVTGVTVDNLATVNAAVANQTAGTTAQIQALANNGAATVTNSTLTASPTTVAADGSTSSTITMRAKDADNNSLSAGGLTVSMSESGSATLTDVIDNEDGTYTATITNTTAETVTVTASFGGADVAETADVTFSFVTEVISHGGFTYNTVQSLITNEVWLDKNLGASQVCINGTESDCYGGRYQWGRATDGHQLTTSSVSSVTLPTISAISTQFINNDTDWTSADTLGASRSTAWSDSSGNGICPQGFRVPLSSEILDEINSTTPIGHLALPVGGFRDRSGAPLGQVGSQGYLWASDVLSVSSIRTQYVYYVSDFADKASYGSGVSPTHGLGVRCIKN